MELKSCWTTNNIPDYDSTKENFDELEKRINKIAQQLLVHIEIANELIPKVEDRLTALEAKDDPWSYKACPWVPGEPKVKSKRSIDTDGRIECPEKDCAKYPCKLDLEDGPASFICHGKIPKLEAKVDAPEKRFIKCVDCIYETCCTGCLDGLKKQTPDTCGTCPQFPGNGNACWWPGGYMHMVDANMKRCCGKEQPPPTCGNCAKAWRRDDLYGVDVVACNQGEHWMTRYLVETCPHHERREA